LKELKQRKMGRTAISRVKTELESNMWSILV